MIAERPAEIMRTDLTIGTRLWWMDLPRVVTPPGCKLIHLCGEVRGNESTVQNADLEFYP